MGVLNVTPDSFFDGGKYFDTTSAIARGLAMAEEGADIVDVGGESSRPGALPVDEHEELRRVLPVVAALSGKVRVSIDTMKKAVAEQAVDAGATLLNDVARRLTDVAAQKSVGLILMHMRGTPKDMQADPQYNSVSDEVFGELLTGAAAARAKGVREVYVDPGIGFGKTVEHNLVLLRCLPELVGSGEAVVIGTSRKSFIGRILAAKNAPPLGVDDRFEGSLASALWAMAAGVTMVRVHDVKPTADAARLFEDPSTSFAIASQATS
jgi:dihydropteroate synthase